nr:beta-ketoacyl-[acyl-carrier-protein] synthase family protein [Pirellula sp.]
MSFKDRTSQLPDEQRIVMTSVGLTSPNGNDLESYRDALLNGRSGVQNYNIRYVGDTFAGVCQFEATKYQSKRDIRRGTRAGTVGIWGTAEAIRRSGLDWDRVDRSRVGIYIGVTEHGNVETENEIYSIKGYDYDVSFWSHHHNPRTVANNPAGEIALNFGITGPHYTIGAACAAGNAGIIQGVQMLRLGECDLAVVGGVSESIHTFGIFASFKSQGALASHPDPTKASRPFDIDRNGIVVSEGSCIYLLERLSDAKARGANILAEIVSYAINTDATDFVLTNSGDSQEIQALRTVFAGCEGVHFNNTKSFIGHTMGAAGALELAGNLPAFQDGVCHATINVDNLDEACAIPGLVINQPKELGRVDYILNNSFGMLGINSVLIVR